MSLVVGLDPGLEGGVAVLGFGHGRVQEVITTFVMPVKAHFTDKGKEVDVGVLRNKLLCCLLPDERVSLVAIERVGHTPIAANKARRQNPKAMFTFGDGFGLMRGVIIGLGWPRVYPLPQQWQKALFTGLRKESNPKKRALSFVNRRYPAIQLMKSDRASKPHPGIVDALCLMEYARRLAGFPESLADRKDDVLPATSGEPAISEKGS
jgi:hypothetical protein